MLADATSIVIGITCDDPDPAGIVSFSVRRDAILDSEDHVRKPGLHEWPFNVQRRIQRRLENDRWALPNRQYQITQTSRALLTNLPDFDLALGFEVQAGRDRWRRRSIA